MIKKKKKLEKKGQKLESDSPQILEKKEKYKLSVGERLEILMLR